MVHCGLLRRPQCVRCHRIATGSPQPAVHKAMVCEEMGDLSAAKRELQEALALQPAMSTAERNLRRIEKLQEAGGESTG